ncbi:MAG: DUF3349 domain-containing protein [Mycobacterium sp.]
MHNRTSESRYHLWSDFPHPPSVGPAEPTRISADFRSVIRWLRSGYPVEAPPTGYSPLLALNGPMALNQRQTQHIVDQLADAPADTTDIEVAITKITDRLPTQCQTRAVAMTLHPN